ncbi:MAG: 4-hydroxybenzoate 3-monooxygenase [Acidimicrobiia bacterium]|nr:4-hydroxybenzoate 3-monooxygenase [Acidimicrobiia bacterium]
MTSRTKVGIVGAGPAGLVLANLLLDAGVDCVVLERQSRRHCETRVRAGLLEHPSVAFLVERGWGERLLAEGKAHEGTVLRFGGRSHRIPYAELAGGRPMHVYPQQELVSDLIGIFLDRGGELHFDVPDVALADLGGEPRITSSVGEWGCDVVAGCDGFLGVSRASVPAGQLQVFDRHHEFGWVAMLAAAPPSTEEIIYALHAEGFAGHMLRTPTISRYYLQCPPDDDIANWPDERIWAGLQTRLGEQGWELQEGPVLEKGVVEMRSYVVEPMRYGRLFLVGDAAHIVPPVGAKGMNLAIWDARHLAEAVLRWVGDGDEGGLDAYSETCLRRIWRVQEFSLWMAHLLHRLDGGDPFLERSQLARLEYLCSSPAAATSFAENYVGLEQV